MLDLREQDYRLPEQRPYLHFFREVHGREAFLKRVHVALWLKAPPPHLNGHRLKAGGDLVAMGWRVQGQQQPQIRYARIELLPESIFGLVEDVVFVRWETSPPLLKQMETGLGYALTIPGQEAGWWFVERSDVPSKQPTWRPTGALLAPRDSSAAKERLVLVEVDDRWGVLSEKGQHTYTFGQALAAGKTIWFMTEGRCVYAVTPAPSIKRGRVERTYGRAAADRARTDAAALQVVVQADPGT